MQTALLNIKGRNTESLGISPQRAPAFVPQPDGLKGYMIGNLMEYREEAMDLKPGVRTDNNANLTAREDWFVSYTKGNPMQRDLRESVQKGLRKEGF